MNRALRILGLAVGMLSLLNCHGNSRVSDTVRAQEKAASTAEVSIDNFSFSSMNLTVTAGTTVKWTNRDDIPHTVVSTDGVFKSKVLDTDEKFSFTFSKPGTYPYFCSIHPTMTAKVIVQ